MAVRLPSSIQEDALALRGSGNPAHRGPRSLVGAARSSGLPDARRARASPLDGGRPADCHGGVLRRRVSNSWLCCTEGYNG